MTDKERIKALKCEVETHCFRCNLSKKACFSCLFDTVKELITLVERQESELKAYSEMTSTFMRMAEEKALDSFMDFLKEELSSSPDSPGEPFVIAKTSELMHRFKEKTRKDGAT